MAKKDFARKNPPSATEPVTPSEPLEPQAAQIPPPCTSVSLDKNHTGHRQYDFQKHYGQGADEIVYYCQHLIELLIRESRATNGQSLAMTTIVSYCQNGLKWFLPFCAVWSSALDRELTLADIDQTLIQRFVQYLGESDLAQNGQRNAYKDAKAVLKKMGQRGWIAHGIFPKNPYPRTNHNTDGEKALSQPEFAQVTHAIKTELRRLASKEGRFSTYDLGICVLAIAARTGLNPTPILELPVDCLREHPLKADRRLLISYKRRGNNTHIQSLRRSEDIELFATVMPDVTRIIDAVNRTNAADREASDYPHLLFVYESQAKSNAGAKLALSYINLQDAIRAWMTHHGLTDDDGGRLRLSVMRLRKTFENRIMELSGGDAFVAAAMNGHSPSIAAEHYHEPPKDAVANFRFLGEVLVQSLREHDAEEAAPAGVNTPVAACKDPVHGHRAPKDGSYCTNFLQCFRCQSFVVTADDLYRLYSFYWLLIRERDRIGAKRWKRYYGHIVRTIDNNIAPQFDPEAVREARVRAWRDPHPYWRDPGMLEGMTDG